MSNNLSSQDSAEIEPSEGELQDKEIRKIVQVIEQRFFHFSGPIPPPEILRQYGEVLPSLPDRIVTLAEKEQLHRHQQDHRELSWKYSGTRYGALLVMCTLLGSFGLLYEGKNLGGLTTFIIAVTMLIGTALYRHKYAFSPSEKDIADDPSIAP